MHFAKPKQSIRPLLLVVAVALVPVGHALADTLRAYNVDRTRISVSGLSSGGYMAQQFHVAHSGLVMGAGIFAGGPYFCAQGSLVTALNTCMQTHLGAPPVAQLVASTRDESRNGTIDDTANLRNDRVFLFSGTRDTTVTPPVMDALRDYYANFAEPGNLRYVDDVAAAHAMITEDQGNACAFHGAPFINDCDFDAAGELLKHIYGELAPRSAPSGQLLTYPQAEFLPNPTAHGMNQNGHIYVPTNCADATAACALHVVFHGCKQYEELIGPDYFTRTGYNEWAEANDIIILYPQAKDSSGNPNGCWDWWGYDDANYYRQSGRQIQAVKAMIDRVISGAPGDSEAPAAPTGLVASGVENTSIDLAWNANDEADLIGYNVYAATASPATLTAINRRNAEPVIGTNFAAPDLEPATAYFLVITAVDASGNESAPSGEVTSTTLTEPPCRDFRASTFAHAGEGRAALCYFWFACASGSGDFLGFYNTFNIVTVQETAPGHFEAGVCR